MGDQRHDVKRLKTGKKGISYYQFLENLEKEDVLIHKSGTKTSSNEKQKENNNGARASVNVKGNEIRIADMWPMFIVKILFIFNSVTCCAKKQEVFVL